MTGCMGDDFKSTFLTKNDVKDPYTSTGLFRTITSSRLSYQLNLLGPNMVIDSACSSSSVAIHLACQGLKTGIFHSSLSFSLSLYQHALVLASPYLHLGPRSRVFSAPPGWLRGERFELLTRWL